jgi:oxygen-independent coproporphyrinogen-3 oxidase
VLPRPFGIYVHVPFCLARCHYCAFATWDDRPQLIRAYAAALVREVRSARAEGLSQATSAFFGGGTPSLLDADQLGSVVAALPLAPGAEVTVECNPDTVDTALLAGYRAAGVNRISLGVQSMVPHVLSALGRTHDPTNVVRAVEAIAAAGFPSWNMDLIYGAVGESLADWEETLRLALALEPPHVSAYGLTVERGRRSPPTRPATPTTTTRPTSTCWPRRPRRRGLASYEVSNWARPGHECRTTSSTGARATTGASGAPPTPTRRAGGGGTSGPPSATSPSSSGGADRGGRRGARRRGPAHRGPAAGAADASRGAGRAVPTTTTSPAWWSGAAAGPP